MSIAGASCSSAEIYHLAALPRGGGCVLAICQISLSLMRAAVLAPLVQLGQLATVGWRAGLRRELIDGIAQRGREPNRELRRRSSWPASPAEAYPTMPARAPCSRAESPETGSESAKRPEPTTSAARHRRRPRHDLDARPRQRSSRSDGIVPGIRTLPGIQASLINRQPAGRRASAIGECARRSPASLPSKLDSTLALRNYSDPVASDVARCKNRAARVVLGGRIHVWPLCFGFLGCERLLKSRNRFLEVCLIRRADDEQGCRPRLLAV